MFRQNKTLLRLASPFPIPPSHAQRDASLVTRPITDLSERAPLRSFPPTKIAPGHRLCAAEATCFDNHAGGWDDEPERIALALNTRGVSTLFDGGRWHANHIWRVLARLPV
jgi:hypothetical protein